MGNPPGGIYESYRILNVQKRESVQLCCSSFGEFVHYVLSIMFYCVLSSSIRPVYHAWGSMRGKPASVSRLQDLTDRRISHEL